MLFAVAGCSQDGSDSKTPAGSQASGGAMPAVAKDDLKVGVIHIGEPAGRCPAIPTRMIRALWPCRRNWALRTARSSARTTFPTPTPLKRRTPLKSWSRKAAR